MMSHLIILELARLRQQELLDVAAEERLAHQLRANAGKRNPRYVGAAFERFVRRCLPSGLIVRHSAG
jgi:hypothetical protein